MTRDSLNFRFTQANTPTRAALVEYTQFTPFTPGHPPSQRKRPNFKRVRSTATPGARSPPNAHRRLLPSFSQVAFSGRGLGQYFSGPPINHAHGVWLPSLQGAMDQCMYVHKHLCVCSTPTLPADSTRYTLPREWTNPDPTTILAIIYSR